MDLMGMMGKLKETQQKMEESKNRLNSVLVDEQSNDGLLQVTLTANREIKFGNCFKQSHCKSNKRKRSRNGSSSPVRDAKYSRNGYV
jgi:hypothetical protein